MVDIKHINYIVFSDKTAENTSTRNLFPVVILGFVYLLKRFVSSVVHNPLWYRWKRGHYDILFFKVTKNNQVSLDLVEKKVTSTSISVDNGNEYPTWLLYLISIFFSWHLIFVYYKSNQEDRAIIKKNYNWLLRTYGCNYLAKRMLNRYSIRCLVLANDHSTMHRCLLLESQKKQIKSLYVQHASVSEIFPPLSFTVSCLDGRDSLEKYKSCGPILGNVLLTGGTRFDHMVPHKAFPPDVVNIGVALNLVDNIDKVKAFIQQIIKLWSDEKKLALTVRQHPRLYDNNFVNWSEGLGCYISDSRIETSFEFLSKIDVLVANESSIHLDAAMMGIPSFLYNYSDCQLNDYYGFGKKGLLTRIEDAEKLIGYLNTGDLPLPDNDSVRYFDAAYGTDHAFHVSEVVANVIDDLVENKVSLFDNFIMVEEKADYHLFVYR